MGIHGLTKLLSDEAPGCMKEVDLDSLTGRKVAVDASMAMYQFLVSCFLYFFQLFFFDVLTSKDLEQVLTKSCPALGKVTAIVPLPNFISNKHRCMAIR